MTDYIQIMKSFVLTGLFLIVVGFLSFIIISIVEIYKEQNLRK